MSRPIDQSCDNCKHRQGDFCLEWKHKCPIDYGEIDQEDYSVRWCQYWTLKQENNILDFLRGGINE